MTVEYIDLFPDCMLPDCDTPGIHQHILPHQQEILNCDTKFLYVQGGVGSAKTIALAAKCVKLCLDIPENRGVVGRRDYPLLFDTSWLDITRCIKRLVERGKFDEDWYRKKMFSRKQKEGYTLITFPNDSVIQAMETKNILRGLGASYGFFWIDDAMESPETIFIGDETNAGLISRLRLPHVGFYRNTDGTTQNMLRGFISTNPPPVNHWLHKIFGKKEGTYKIGDDDVTWMQTATHQNPFVGSSYAKTIMAFQKQAGRSSNDARRIIFGESIPAYGGVKVFPQFDHAKHVGSFKFDNSFPLVVGMDFGFHHPAAVFSNLFKCEYGVNHYISLSEVADAFSVTIYQFYDDFINPHIKANYSDASMIVWGGDRAGYRASSSNKDKRGDMKILIDEYSLPFKHRVLDLKNSLQYMRALLNPKTPCKCGREIILIDQLGCPILIGALEGGYKYQKSKEKIADKPVEDKYFADIACAWRYGAENYVKWGIPYGYIENISTTTKSPSKPWDWMEYSDKQVAEMLLR